LKNEIQPRLPRYREALRAGLTPLLFFKTEKIKVTRKEESLFNE